MNPQDQDPLQQSQPAADPNTFFQPVATVEPPVQPGATAVGQATQMDSTLPGAAAPKKKILIIAGAALLVLLIAIVTIALLAGSSSKKEKTAKPIISQVAGPVAATSASVQQGDDAISQYLSGLDDNKDFPAKALDDTTLGLQ